MFWLVLIALAAVLACAVSVAVERRVAREAEGHARVTMERVQRRLDDYDRWNNGVGGTVVSR